MTATLPERAVRTLTLTIDGQEVTVPEGSTIMEACTKVEIETPTLCYLETLTPVNACRVCVVELEGSRVLVPACARKAEPGMVIHTDSERVRKSRRLVLELLASSVDLSYAPAEVHGYLERYDAAPERFGTAAPAEPEQSRDHMPTGHHHMVEDGQAATVAQPAKLDNLLYMRDYSRCILCYKCVEACGVDAQNTFAISAAGRGFDAHISTELALPLPDSACVYCGNCVAVCPTGALMFKSEYDMRQNETWDEPSQTVTDTICPYCGVGCTLQLHVQENRIVKVTSPLDHDVTLGNLCVKGRFGYDFVQSRAGKSGTGASGDSG
ncbi:MAG TPA: 2Fe-2S iron-sulfur cluster-binding protein [Acidothermaceae bacterium]|nr:2Fe-2S iron-sulfur cluster-binding protein [Acidothermaceae bacterium]